MASAETDRLAIPRFRVTGETPIGLPTEQGRDRGEASGPGRLRGAVLGELAGC